MATTDNQVYQFSDLKRSVQEDSELMDSLRTRIIVNGISYQAFLPNNQINTLPNNRVLPANDYLIGVQWDSTLHTMRFFVKKGTGLNEIVINGVSFDLTSDDFQVVDRTTYISYTNANINSNPFTSNLANSLIEFKGNANEIKSMFTIDGFSVSGGTTVSIKKRNPEQKHTSHNLLGDEPLKQVNDAIDTKLDEQPDAPTGSGLTPDEKFKVSKLEVLDQVREVEITDAHFSETSGADAITKDIASSYTASANGTLFIAIPSGEANEHPKLTIGVRGASNRVLAKKEVFSSSPEFFLYSHQVIAGATYDIAYRIHNPDLKLNIDVKELKREEAQLSQIANDNSTQITDIRKKTDLISIEDKDNVDYSVPEWFEGEFLKGGVNSYSATFFIDSSNVLYSGNSDFPNANRMRGFPESASILGFTSVGTNINLFVKQGVRVTSFSMNGTALTVPAFRSFTGYEAYSNITIPTPISAGDVVNFEIGVNTPTETLEGFDEESHKTLLWTSIDPTNAQNQRPHALLRYDTTDISPSFSAVRNFLGYRLNSSNNKMEVFKSFFVPSGEQSVKTYARRNDGQGGKDGVHSTHPIPETTDFTQSLPQNNEIGRFEIVNGTLNDRTQTSIVGVNVPRTATQDNPVTYRYVHSINGVNTNYADFSVFYTANGDLRVRVTSLLPPVQDNANTNATYFYMRFSYDKVENVPAHISEEVLWSSSDLSSRINLAMLKYNDTATIRGRWGLNINGAKAVLEFNKASTSANPELIGTSPEVSGGIANVYVRELTTAITNDVLDERLNTIRQNAQDSYAGQRRTENHHDRFMDIDAQLRGLDENGNRITLSPEGEPMEVQFNPTQDNIYPAVKPMLIAGSNITLGKNDSSKAITIHTPAEQNVQSDWNESNQSSDSYIKNKPDITSSSPDTAEQIVDKLETLNGDERLDASAIKNLADADINLVEDVTHAHFGTDDIEGSNTGLISGTTTLRISSGAGQTQKMPVRFTAPAKLPEGVAYNSANGEITLSKGVWQICASQIVENATSGVNNNSRIWAYGKVNYGGKIRHAFRSYVRYKDGDTGISSAPSGVIEAGTQSVQSLTSIAVTDGTTPLKIEVEGTTQGTGGTIELRNAHLHVAKLERGVSNAQSGSSTAVAEVFETATVHFGSQPAPISFDIPESGNLMFSMTEPSNCNAIISATKLNSLIATPENLFSFQDSDGTRRTVSLSKHGSSKKLYVSNGSPNPLSLYAINSTDGSLNRLDISGNTITNTRLYTKAQMFGSTTINNNLIRGITLLNGNLYLAYAESNSRGLRIYRINLSTGQATSVNTSTPDPLNVLIPQDLSSDGTSLYIGTTEGLSAISSANTNEVHVVLPRLNGVGIARSNRWLGFSRINNNLSEKINLISDGSLYLIARGSIYKGTGGVNAHLPSPIVRTAITGMTFADSSFATRFGYESGVAVITNGTTLYNLDLSTGVATEIGAMPYAVRGISDIVNTGRDYSSDLTISTV